MNQHSLLFFNASRQNSKQAQFWREALKKPLKGLHFFGGESEIRTHGTLTGTPLFESGTLNHSVTSP